MQKKKHKSEGEQYSSVFKTPKTKKAVAECSGRATRSAFIEGERRENKNKRKRQQRGGVEKRHKRVASTS
jgi:hypothetical protein